MSLKISSDFDGGNIVVARADDPADIRLNIRKDTESDFYQWFYFHLSGGKDQDCVFHIENAGGAAYPKGWDNYYVVASYDQIDWFRISETDYRDGQLIWSHRPTSDSLYYAYFAPYNMIRHKAFIADVLQGQAVSQSVLAHSKMGQAVDCLHLAALGHAPKKEKANTKVIWIIARQHPGETMAQWWIEGCLGRLLDPTDSAAQSLRQQAEFFIVPNMNPDGSKLGNLRVNSVGANLNREWGVATTERSPEVLGAIQAMDAAVPNIVLDVHGDEALPYNFIAGAEGIPDYSAKQAADLAKFLSAYKRASSEFQTTYGYGLTGPGRANMTLCTNFTARRYDCLSMTLEMPFKDNANANAPCAAKGWSPERSMALGAASLEAFLDVVGQI